MKIKKKANNLRLELRGSNHLNLHSYKLMMANKRKINLITFQYLQNSILMALKNHKIFLD
jgi:hypothetical protein